MEVSSSLSCSIVGLYCAAAGNRLRSTARETKFTRSADTRAPAAAPARAPRKGTPTEVASAAPAPTATVQATAAAIVRVRTREGSARLPQRLYRTKAIAVATGASPRAGIAKKAAVEPRELSKATSVPN